MDELNLSENLRRIIEISEIFTFIQDKRKEGVLRENFLFYTVLKIIEKKLNLEKDLILYLTPPEFMKEEKFSTIQWDEIRKRRDYGAVVLFYQEDCFVLSKEQYEKEIPVETFFASLSDIKEICGSVAFKGFVKGIVRVVHNISEIQDFNEGEILIVNQTTPEFIPAMKKALAFVTDQGGITCHAAIVAREMKKPCIIGTKIATKVLKDGDLVEVDANQGIVKILDSKR
jgi:phosphohistidine swiveling domain-containing protein